MLKRLAIIGPRTLTAEKGKVVLKAIKDKDYGAVRAAVQAYDELGYNFAETSLDDKALAKAVRGFIEGASDRLPKALDPTDDIVKLVGPEMTEWGERMSRVGYLIGFGPDEADVWRVVRDPKTGDIVGVAPWLDWASEASAAYRPGQFARIRGALFNEIRGDRIQREAKNRFIRYATQDWGISPADADRLFHAIGLAANDMNVMPRGMSGTKQWEAAKKVVLQKEIASKIGPREVAALISRAYEGKLTTVGATQKFSGAVKTEFSGMGNVVGQIAEHFYPIARFTINPFFQLQEFVEPFFLAVMRGVKPGVHLSDLDAETLNIVNNLLYEGRHLKFDQAEFASVYVWGAAASKKTFGSNTRVGNIARRVIPEKIRNKGGFSVAEAKQVAYAGQIRQLLGKEMYQAFESIRPGFFDELHRHYSVASGRALDRGEVAIRWLNEKGAAGAAGGDYQQVLARISKPADMGAQSVVELPFLRRLLDLESTADVFAAARKGTLTRDQVHDALTTYGAHEDYIARAWNYISGPTPKEFQKALAEVYGLTSKEAKMHMSLLAARAEAVGMDLHQYVATTFSKVPQRVSGRRGLPGGALFQTAKETFVARGIPIEEVDSPRVLDVRAGMERYLPKGTDVDFGVGGKGRGSAIALQRGIDQGAEALAPKVGSFPIMRGGKQVGHIGPTDIPGWKQSIVNTLGIEEAREAGLWYHEMATTFLAITDGMSSEQLFIVLGKQVDEIAPRAGFTLEQTLRQEAASKMLVAWGLSQLNTSPSAGFANLLRLIDDIGFGARPGGKSWGLNSANLSRIIRDGEAASQQKVGEKLFDFLDSIRLASLRNFKSHLGDTRMPAAGDIWAARDVGFVDQATLARFAKTEGVDVGEAARRLGVISRKDPRVMVRETYTTKGGKTRTRLVTDNAAYDRLVKEEGLQPVFVSVSDNMYEYIVQFYNDAAGHLNAEAFLGRTDWTAADAQAMGWVRAQKSFGINSDNPVAVFMSNSRQVSYEIKAGIDTRYAEILPPWDELPEVTQRAIMDDWDAYIGPKVESMTGVKILSKVRGSGGWMEEGSPTFTKNVMLEVLGTEDQIQDAIDVMAYLSQQNAIFAVKPVGASVADPNKGHFWAVDIIPDRVLTEAEAEAMALKAAESSSLFGGGQSIFRADDGRLGVRAMFFPREWTTTKKELFTAFHPDSEFDELAASLGGGVKFVRRVVSSVAAGGGDSNFKEGEGGAAILQSLSGRGRGALAEQLEREHGFDAFAHLDDLYQRHAPEVYERHRLLRESRLAGAADPDDLGDPNTLYQLADDITGDDPRVVRAIDAYRAADARLDDLLRTRDELLDAGDTAGARSLKPQIAEARLAAEATLADGIRTRLGSLEDTLFQLDETGSWADEWEESGIDVIKYEHAAKVMGMEFRKEGRGFRLALPDGGAVEGGSRVAGYVSFPRPGYGDWAFYSVDDYGMVVGKTISVADEAAAKEAMLDRGAKALGRVADDEFIADVYRPDIYQHTSKDNMAEALKAQSMPEARVVKKGAYPELAVARGRAPDVAPNRQVKRRADITPEEEASYQAYGKADPDSLCPAIGYSSYVEEFTGCQHPKGHTGSHVWHHSPGGSVKAERWDVSLTVEQYKEFMRARGIDLQMTGGARPAIRGAASFGADGRAVIYATSKANRTTALHELAHVFERDLDPSLRSIVLDEFGREGGDATAWTRETSEWFADGFNRYLATRQAPTLRLRNAFNFFGKWLKRILKQGKQGPQPISDEMAKVYDELLTLKVDAAAPFDVEAETFWQASIEAARRAEDEAYTTQYFRRGRSWLERSANHPYLGYYPVSYYWGKILPEMVRFLMISPFGVEFPMGGLAAANKVWSSVAQQREFDPEFREYMEENKDAFRAWSMLIPGTPWELPVNASLPLRRLAQADQENRLRQERGQDQLPVAYGKIAEDVTGYLGLGPSIKYGSQMLGFTTDSATSMLSGAYDDLSDVFAGNPQEPTEGPFIPQAGVP